MSRIYPLFEYDSTVPAVIEPAEIIQPVQGIAQHAVLCFFQDIIQSLKEEHNFVTLDPGFNIQRYTAAHSPLALPTL